MLKDGLRMQPVGTRREREGMGWYAFVALAPRWNARQGREGGAVPDAVMRGETRTRLGYGGTESHPPDREESAGSTGRYIGKSPFKK